jgi:hypothetical protein
MRIFPPALGTDVQQAKSRNLAVQKCHKLDWTVLEHYWGQPNIINII